MDSKNILKKYGWKEGEGLGRNKDGISAPIKANLKFDNAGFGYQMSEDFGDNPWEKMFEEAIERLKKPSQSDTEPKTTSRYKRSLKKSNEYKKGKVKTASGKLKRIEAQNVELLSKINTS